MQASASAWKGLLSKEVFGQVRLLRSALQSFVFCHIPTPFCYCWKHSCHITVKITKDSYPERYKVVRVIESYLPLRRQSVKGAQSRL